MRTGTTSLMGGRMTFFHTKTRMGLLFSTLRKCITTIPKNQVSKTILTVCLSWESDKNTVDKETGPNNNKENGDGFTAFEEYRGFMTTQYATAYGYASAGHTRTDPGTKDVFYVIRNSMSSYGIGDAKTHHPFLFTEMHERCVNKPFTAVWNATHTGYDSDVTNEYGWINTNSDGIPNWEYVHAIRIEAPQDYLNSTTHVLENIHPDQPDDYMGLAAGTNKPYAYSLISIYVDAITAEKQNNTDFANVSVSDLVANVISHEVGLMVNLDHCSHYLPPESPEWVSDGSLYK